MIIKNKSALSILLASTFLSTAAIAADVIYTIQEGSENNYNFITQEADVDGNLVTKYYKIVLNSSAFTDSANISWQEVDESQKNESDTDLSNGTISGVVPVKMFDKNQFIKYVYTKPTDYTVSSERINDTLSSANVTNIVFSEISSDVVGEAIYNSKDNMLTDITADFIGNFNNGKSGGVVYNSGNIGKINGSFVYNYALTGGVVTNMFNATIDGIYGDFIKNYATSSALISGMAIGNRGTINEIIGNFIGNNVTSVGDVNGAAIYNAKIIGNIDANFIGNGILSNSYNAYGGAVANYMTIEYMEGDFLGNYAQSKAGNAYGGAIYNNGTIGSLTGNFISNDAFSSSDLSLGGAIFTTGDMTLTTQGKTLLMSGNYTQDNIRGKNYNALFIDASLSYFSPTITFDTTGGGTWIINDNIEGGKLLYSAVDYSNQYNLVFKGDDIIGENGKTTQYIAINNDIINTKEVTVENTTLRLGAFDHKDDTAKNSIGKGAFVSGEGSDVLPTLSLTNAAFDLYNGYQEKVELTGWSSDNG